VPLLFVGRESRMGRLELPKQQSQGNQIEHEQHDEGDAKDGDHLIMPCYPGAFVTEMFA
jgi:hypothetical protein